MSNSLENVFNSKNEIGSPTDGDETIVSDQFIIKEQSDKQQEEDELIEENKAKLNCNSKIDSKLVANNPFNPLKKRKSWYLPLFYHGAKSNQVKSAPPRQETTSQIQRSRSWFFRAKSESDVHSPTTTAQYSTHVKSSESDQAEILSSSSLEKNKKSNSVIFDNHIVEFDYPIPIIHGNYSGNPSYTPSIKNPHLFYNQLTTRQFLQSTVELTYNSWIVWECSDKREKRILTCIDNKDQFIEFIEKFNYSHVVIMRKLLVPNYDFFKNGYLIRIKVSHTKNDKTNAVKLYSQLSDDSMFRKFPRRDIKINVCGIEYQTKQPKLTEITCWIHPILSMSFDITDQVSLLLQLISYNGPIQRITLVDLNNRSKSTIKARFIS